MIVRRATAADAPAIAALVSAGLAGYASFAPAGWAPPDPATDLRLISERLAGPATWARVALDGEATVGVVAFLPHPVERGLAHLWLLFVAPEHWGGGLARTLHADALAAARGAGYHRMRLFTPEGQARSRAFYRREGWREHGEPTVEFGLGLTLVELRRPL